MSENQEAPKVESSKTVWPVSLTVRDQELETQYDKVSKEPFVEYTDPKLGVVKLHLRVFAGKSDKAGCKFVVPEWGGFQASVDRYGSDTIADIVDSFVQQKIATNLSAKFNSKTNPKLVSDITRETYLKQLSERENWLNTADEALDWAPFERGESMSGLQREQRAISAAMGEAQKKGDFKALQEHLLKMVDVANRMTEFMKRQADEYQEQLEAVDSIAVGTPE